MRTRTRNPLRIAAAVALMAVMASGIATLGQQATPSPSHATPGTPGASPGAGGVASMPLDVKIGQMIIAGVQGQSVSDDARHLIEDLHIGNVVLMGPNIDSPGQVLSLTQGLQALALESNGIPLAIATDQEGGLVQRLNEAAGFTRMPSEAFVGDITDPLVARAYGRMVGEELAAVGITMDFAPVLDVNTNPDNPVIGSLWRSFGTTAEQVKTVGIPFIAGLHDAGIAATGKHFPGHGRTTTDSHNSLPFVEASRADLDAVDLVPFRAAIAEGVDAIMPAHVVFEAFNADGLPATVSEPVLTGLLRGELGFRGVIVTDDMGMEGITTLFPPEEAGVRAVLAGADVITCVRMTDTPGACPPEMIEPLRDGLLAAVEDGRIPMERIDASVERVLALKSAYGMGPATGDALNTIQGASHLRVIADVYDAVADRREQEGRP